MIRYVKTLKDVPVFSGHNIDAHPFKTIPAGELLIFNREKRREGVNWLEILIEAGEKAYLRKDREAVFICRYGELSDDEVQGFGYEENLQTKKTFAELFEPVNIFEPVSPYDHFSEKSALAEIRRVPEQGKSRIDGLSFRYDSRFVTVHPFTMSKNEAFYITNDRVDGNPLVIEIDNFLDKKGYLLKKTGFTETEDKWMGYLAVAIMLITVIGLIIAFLSAGWLVISPLLLIPGFIAAIILLICFKIILSILSAIFHQVRIRL